MKNIVIKEEWINEIVKLEEKDSAELFMWLLAFDIDKNFIFIPENKKIQRLCLRMIIYWANHTCKDIEV